MAGTPLTLAETASVFGEQLTFRALLEAETDPVQRRIMLAGKIEDGLNTVVRQIAFVEFEQRVHAAPAVELTADELGAVAAGADREPRPGVPLRRFLPGLLELHPALHPRAVLRLRLRLRRLPGELALCGLSRRNRRVRSTLSRVAARRRHAAPPGAAGAVRPRCHGPRVLGQGPRGHRGHDRRAGRRARGAAWPTVPRAARRTLSGRVWRYAQVSGTVGGLARVAGARFLGIDIDKPQHAEELRLRSAG